MKCFALALLWCSAVACSSSGSTAPAAPDAWAQGTWVAVRMNAAPLPFRNSPNFPYIQYDSLTVSVLFAGTSRAAAVYPNQTLFFSANAAPSPIICDGALGSVIIGATTLSTRPTGLFTSIGGCNSSFVTFDFTRLGDSLAGTWAGVSVRLVSCPQR